MTEEQWDLAAKEAERACWICARGERAKKYVANDEGLFWYIHPSQRELTGAACGASGLRRVLSLDDAQRALRPTKEWKIEFKRGTGTEPAARGEGE